MLQFQTNAVITLGTLGQNVAIFGPSKIDASRLQGMYVIWTKIAGYLAGKTTTEGPIIFGISCNLTVAELADILTDDPQSAQEVTKTGPGSWYMPIMLFGEDEVEGDINGGQGATNVQAQSKFTKYNVGWTVPEGNTMDFFAFNIGSALTTGATIKLASQVFGAWLRD